MILRQYLWFRTPVVAVDPEQAAMHPGRLYKEICDTNMYDLGQQTFLASATAAPLGCSDGASTRRNVSARQARSLYVTDISLTGAA